MKKEIEGLEPIPGGKIELQALFYDLLGPNSFDRSNLSKFLRFWSKSYERMKISQYEGVCVKNVFLHFITEIHK